jgi:hypothetical protein
MLRFPSVLQLVCVVCSCKVCDAGTTKITSPNYYRHDSSGWCSEVVAQLLHDFYNLEYRRECQRWLGGALPDSVAQVQLTFCYEYDNSTVQYRVGLCCQGQFFSTPLSTLVNKET